MRNRTGMRRAFSPTRALVVGLLLSLGACKGESRAAAPVLDWTQDAESGALPIRLTGSDGHGLSLVSVRAEAIVQPPLAFTELHLRFRNPENRQREGRFEITLPPGAEVSRFAMRIGERFQEGEVVERRAAQQAYEDFLHRRQDPALLEQTAANQFSARVFPIGAGEEKELILSYSEALSDPAVAYRLHLAGLPAMQELSVRVLAGSEQLSLSKRDFAPRGDLTVTQGEGGKQPASLAVQNGDLLMARVTPQFSAQPAALEGLTVAFDTSASTALSYRDRVTRLGSLVEALRARAGKDFPVQLIAFDQTSEVVFTGPASELGRAGLAALKKRMPLGATDLGRALDDLARTATQPRVLLFSDAVVTAGAQLEGDLDARLMAMKEHGVRRVDVVLLSGIRDEALAERIVSGPFDHAGTVLSERASQPQLVQALTAAVRARVPVSVENSSWWWPRTVPALLPGQSVVVLAKRSGEGAAQLSVGDWKAQAKPVKVHRALLERAWASTRIAELETEQDAMADEDTAQRATLQAEATALSVRHRVLSRRTALLVLETEADYARFDIPRTALSDILVVGEHGLDVVTGAARAEQMVAFGQPLQAAEEDEPPVPTRDRSRPSMDGFGAAAPEPDPPTGGAPSDNLMAPAEVEASPALSLEDAADMEEPPARRAPMPAARSRSASKSSGSSEARALELAAGPGVSRSTGQGGLSGLAGSRRVAGGQVRTRPNTRPPIAAVAAPPPRPRPSPSQLSAQRARRERAAEIRREWESRPGPDLAGALEGRLLEIMVSADAGNAETALLEAWRWRAEAPGDVLSLLGLGYALRAAGQPAQASRAYGSILDLYPGRADLRRMTGNYLEQLAQVGEAPRVAQDALALAADSYARAREQRPDHPSSHRLYAYALVKRGEHEQAFAALREGYGRSYPDGRFAGAKEILAGDLRIVASAWRAASPKDAAKIDTALAALDLKADEVPSLRFVLSWETDANDVDFHLYDGKKGHAYYGRQQLPSGGRLLADVTTGYGPECFRIDRPSAYPYEISAHYYSRGPMGYGMGKVQVVRHDGHGGLSFDERPFVIMKDKAFVHLGVVDKAVEKEGVLTDARPPQVPSGT